MEKLTKLQELKNKNCTGAKNHIFLYGISSHKLGNDIAVGAQ
jgi:hypothetical protein